MVRTLFLVSVMTLASTTSIAANWKKIAHCTSGNADLIIDVDQDQRSSVQAVIFGGEIHDYFGALGGLEGNLFYNGSSGYSPDAGRVVFADVSRSGYQLGRTPGASFSAARWDHPSYQALENGDYTGHTLHRELVREGNGARLTNVKTNIRKCSGLQIYDHRNGSLRCQGKVQSKPNETAGSWFFPHCEWSF